MKCPLKKNSTEEIVRNAKDFVIAKNINESFGECGGKDCMAAAVITTGLNADKEHINCNYNNIFGGKK